MSTQFSGEPAVIQNSLPAAVNIASSDGNTPVTITTSTPHGLQTGDYFVVEGADDPALNYMPLMAGTVTGSTVVALLAPGATNTAGTLVGGANGTVQATGFGTTYALPSDLTDDMDAASVNVALEALGDRTAYLMRLSDLNRTICYSRWFISGSMEGGAGLTNISAGAGAGIIDDLPHGAIVSTIKVWLVPAVHASLPATMPRLSLLAWNIPGGTLAINQSQSDTSPNVGVYNVAHDLTLTLSKPIVIDRTAFTYSILMEGEASTNSATLPVGAARVLLS